MRVYLTFHFREWLFFLQRAAARVSLPLSLTVFLHNKLVGPGVASWVRAFMQHQSTFILGQKVIQFKPLFKDELLTEVKLLQYEYCGFLMMKLLLDCTREEIVNSGFWMASMVKRPHQKDSDAEPFAYGNFASTFSGRRPLSGQHPNQTERPAGY